MRTTYLMPLALFSALCSAPALAAGATPGNSGPAEIASDRGAPATLPAFTPFPTPQFDASATSRGPLDLDPAAALAGLATVTLHQDGSVTETPASAGMRAILDQFLKGSEVMSSDRAVVGSDDRKQITDAADYPYRAVGLLVSTFANGDTMGCSATLIGPSSVITAAHCVYNHDAGGWTTSSFFVPGATDDHTSLIGTFDVVNANILKGYIDNYKDNYGDVAPWDLAELELASDAGNQVGWLGIRVDDASDFKAVMIGYPGDKPMGTMWEDTCDIPAKYFGELNFVHTCDSYPGSSGSAMFENQNGDLYVRGVNIAEDTDAVPAADRVNYGLRLTDAYYQFLVDNYK
jgi:V8-like Glu-specific endopeptidase